MLILRPPHAGDEDPMRAMREELAPEGFDFLLADGPWEEVLAGIERESAGAGLPPGRVRAEYLVAEVSGEIVGRCSIRHELTDYLLEIGGHIGYAVARRAGSGAAGNSGNIAARCARA